MLRQVWTNEPARGQRDEAKLGFPEYTAIGELGLVMQPSRAACNDTEEPGKPYSRRSPERRAARGASRGKVAHQGARGGGGGGGRAAQAHVHAIPQARAQQRVRIRRAQIADARAVTACACRATRAGGAGVAGLRQGRSEA